MYQIPGHILLSLSRHLCFGKTGKTGIRFVLHLLKSKFGKTNFMKLTPEDINDQKRFRLFLTIPYRELIEFVFEYLKKKSLLIYFFWFCCLFFFCISIFIRIKVAGSFPITHIFLHSFIGLVVLPLICIPLHELLHVIPFLLSGAKNIRIGMYLKQYLFYVSAHRYVATPIQFRVVAWMPFLIISAGTAVLIFLLPGLWKWSLSIFLFAHATMCAGDIALLNLYYLNRNKKIYTWDDVDKKEAYFYEKV